MSSSANTVGVATIDVNTLTNVTATHRVKTVAGFVIWSVRNLTETNVTVCVTDFTPAAGVAALEQADITCLLSDSLCTRLLKPGQQGPIPGHFIGVPGSVYNYTIKVNGSPASDPQLEI